MTLHFWDGGSASTSIMAHLLFFFFQSKLSNAISASGLLCDAHNLCCNHMGRNLLYSMLIILINKRCFDHLLEQ